MAKYSELEEFIHINRLQKKDLAEYLEVSSSMITQYLSGARSLPAKKLEQILKHPTWDKAPLLARTQEYDVIDTVAEVDAFPILPEEVAIKPNTDIREYINDNSGELEHINPSQMLSHADMAERILRTSMMPTFQPDDIVFVRFIQDKMKIVDGDIYYIDSKNRPTMIRQVKFTEDGKLRLIAQNPQYGDIIMCRDEINNIAIIVGLLRMNFSDQYSELESLRRKNDKAMERRNDQMDKILEQQSKLIDFITKTK